jgi:hypothetical protein
MEYQAILAAKFAAEQMAANDKLDVVGMYEDLADYLDHIGTIESVRP